ncbi:hypothetical protein BC827DRAFT_1266128 [Russula dissimulans]|nr:hypothetical protein BC827DRAFT_1266128 [Russula dissimulans]
MSLSSSPVAVAGMLAVLCRASCPPLGVALLGLFITALSWTLRLLPYITLYGMIILSIWIPSHPAEPDVIYHPVHGHPNHIYMRSAFNVTPFTDETKPFELNARTRALIFLLSVPVTSILEKMLFRPVRDFLLQTVQSWFYMRYVLPAQATGSWPDTWPPILNVLRSIQFVADFIDGVTGNDHSSGFPHGQKGRDTDIQPPSSDCDIGMCGGTALQTSPAVQKAPSSLRTVHFEERQKLDSNHNRSPDSVIQSKVQESFDIPVFRKTFISPPRHSLSPPLESSVSKFRTSSAFSKNLSRVVGMLFHYSPYHKPAPRPRCSPETQAFSALSSGFICPRLSRSTPSTQISPLSTLSPNFMTAPGRIAYISSISVPPSTRAEYPGMCQVVEQNQFSGCPEDVHLPYVPQLSTSSILTHTQPFVSISGEERHVQVQCMQSHAFRAIAYQEHRLPVDEPKLTVPTLPIAAERWFDRPAPALETMRSQSQQLSEPMDLDCPQQLMPGPLHAPLVQERRGSAQELSPPAFSPFKPPQGQFGLSQFSEATQSQAFASDRSSPNASPVPEFTSTPLAASHQGEASLESSQPIPPREVSPSCAVVGTQRHPPPTITTRPYFSQLLQGQKATETFTFDHLPDSVIPHFDFSNHAASATQSCSNATEIMSPQNVSDNTNRMGKCISVENVATQILDHEDDPPRASLASSFSQESEVIPLAGPSSPVDSVRPMVGDDDERSNFGSCDSDTDSSDPDYIPSVSDEDDSDSDSALSGGEDPDASGETIVGSSERKESSSRTSESQSCGQNAQCLPNSDPRQEKHRKHS